MALGVPNERSIEMGEGYREAGEWGASERWPPQTPDHFFRASEPGRFHMFSTRAFLIRIFPAAFRFASDSNHLCIHTLPAFPICFALYSAITTLTSLPFSPTNDAYETNC